MAKDETEIGITGKPIPKKKRSPKKQYAFEKKRRENLGQNVGGITYRSDVSPNFNPRSVREELLVDYLLGEGFASDEKSAKAIAGAMSEEWKQNIVERGFGLGFLDLRKPAAKPKAEPTPKPPTVKSSGGAGGQVTVDKQYPATLGGKKGVKSTDAQGTEYFMPYQPQGGLPKPNTLPDLNKAQYKNTYTNTYKDIPASQSTKNPQSHLSRTGVPRVRSATRTYGID
ncbi:hypothetical protein PQC13_gp229 [Synechococcus phage S-SRM01]|uniref:Uncharacterized protein n=1 Tax=Synechococcus phage S-SRM01 TaxID=2781608 RepID=A0A879R1Y3_9CAUD|nr:hypothetical protein PQC13_gp229 [Synechococcus phage S-SRM01]QPX48194.1 hypothetical protein [Synechococcus phage S-SRM01]